MDESLLPDWDHIRSYLTGKDFQQPSTVEETETHQLQIAYLVQHEVLVKAEIPDSGAVKYDRTTMGFELEELMNHDALWKSADKELIKDPIVVKSRAVITPALLLGWLKKHKPK